MRELGQSLTIEFMDPLTRYQEDIDSGHICPDSGQRRVVEALQHLATELNSGSQSTRRWWQRFLNIALDKSTRHIQGIYLWGGVGRGKTYLMDLFYDCVVRPDKERTHFHRFMQQIHLELQKFQGTKDPLVQVANVIAARSRLLCFDEFFVVDIGDAMLLAGLLKALQDRGVIIVTTSNAHPDDLYKNGLQRERFLPAIAMLKQSMKIIEIEQGTDYRLRSLSQARLYHYPIDSETQFRLGQVFDELAPDKSTIELDCKIPILQREIPALRCSNDVVWFEFAALCDGPRSAFDYVELAKLFHAIIISNMPQLTDQSADLVRRFVSLVDELYDRRVKLIIAAEAPISSLYVGQSLAFEFERTRSRLLEMQSHAYLAHEHRG